jgi:hypothetical protein
LGIRSPHRLAGKRLVDLVGEVFVEHPGQGRVNLHVARDHHSEHLGAGQDRQRVVVVVDDNEAGPVVLGQHPHRLRGWGVHADGGVRRRQLVCLHDDTLAADPARGPGVVGQPNRVGWISGVPGSLVGVVLIDP